MPGHEITSLTLTACIAQAAGLLLRQNPFSRCILSGGDTAKGIFEALQAASLELFSEPLPGCAEGLLSISGGRKIPVVTKSGGFGGEDTLIRLARTEEILR